MTDHVVVEAFGDPACPYDFAAEGARLKLRWRYGDDVAWVHRMVVLSESRDEYPSRGVTLQDLAMSRAGIAAQYGVVIDARPADQHVATVVACRAVVAVRRHAPAHVDAFLRHLRVLGLSHRRMLDDPSTTADAATRAGLDPAAVAAWADEPDTQSEVARDMADARAPDAASRVMTERLFPLPDGDGWRYTCPSYRIRHGDRVLTAPGFQPARVYEVLTANVAPQLTPRPLATDPLDVLKWSPYPLSTAEVATIMEAPPQAVRAALEQARAYFAPVANDGYWSSTPQDTGSPTT